MDFLEGTCPACGGVLQLPKGREEIICMYCGVKINVADALKNRPERKATGTDPKVVENLEQIVKDKFQKMLFSVENPLETFKKTEYEKNFLAYYEKNKDILDAIADIYESTDRYMELYQQMVQDLIHEVEQRLSERKPRKAEALLMDYNMTVVVYLLPAVLRYDKKSGEILSEEFLLCWKERFKKADLKASTFEEINEGFRKRYCYITTAVCKSLGKPEDCQELMSLRHFRDDYLQKQENGEALIQQYYNIAPSIVKSIDRLPNSDEIYYNIWREYLSPCITAINENRNQQCMEQYSDMVCNLQEKYFFGEYNS